MDVARGTVTACPERHIQLLDQVTCHVRSAAEKGTAVSIWCGVYFEGQGGLASRLLAPLSHMLIPIINLRTKARDPPSRVCTLEFLSLIHGQ